MVNLICHFSAKITLCSTLTLVERVLVYSLSLPVSLMNLLYHGPVETFSEFVEEMFTVPVRSL